jgi:predicted dehydrogenase
VGNKLKAGVIGLGILGRQHAMLLQHHESTELTAVADLREEAAENMAEKTGAKPYTDYRKMLQRHDLDYVVVATPDWAHREPSVAAIEAGVPAVLQEKPLATTVEDAEVIANAADQRKTRFFVNYSNRGVATNAATHYVIQKGLLGQVVHGEVRLDDNISVPTQMWGPGSSGWAKGSSPAHFLLSHVVDLVRWYFAPADVRQVYAVSHQGVLPGGFDVLDAFLCFDGALKVRVKSEWIKHIEGLVEFYMCFSGSEGTLIHNRRPGFATHEGWRANVSNKLKFPALLKHQQALKSMGTNVNAVWARPQPKVAFLAAGEGMVLPALESLEPIQTDMTELAKAVIQAILDGTTEPACWKGKGPLPTHKDGLQQTRICVAIEESSLQGKALDIA